MGITQLDENDFVLIGKGAQSLGINIPGIVLVLFKAPGDPNCARFDPVFEKISMMEKRLACAFVDIQKHRNIVSRSKSTSTQINGVPELILYMDGRPHARFQGTKNLDSVRGFITKALQYVPSTKSPSVPSQQQRNAYQEPPPQQQQRKYYDPNIGKPPSMKGFIKGAPVGFADQDEEPVLLIPDNCIPWNAPWFDSEEN